MADHVVLNEPAAIDLLLHVHGFALAKLWDGDAEKVGFIVEDGDLTEARAGFWPRDAAPSCLLGIADAHPGEAAELRSFSAAVADGPVRNRVQCMILSPRTVALILLEPDDLRDPTTGMVTTDDWTEMLPRVSTQTGAFFLLAEIRQHYGAEQGLEIPELEALDAIIATRWHDLDALAAATKTARAAMEQEVHVHSDAGDHTRFFLAVLAEATRRRQPDRAIAPRGSA